MTFSIIAVDPRTGELGGAVASRLFALGRRASVASGRGFLSVEPGVGVVVTQGLFDPRASAALIALLVEGATAREAVAQFTAGDERAGERQIAVVDTEGEVGLHTGGRCDGHAGDVDGPGFCVVANTAQGPDVWDAMATTFGRSEGDLSVRLLTAMRAGDAAGGDWRGAISAHLLVEPPTGEPSEAVDLRVDDHQAPVEELVRLLQGWRALSDIERGHGHASRGEYSRAARLFDRALRSRPADHVALLRTGLDAAAAGDTVNARGRVRQAIALNGRWRDELPLMAAQGVPGAAEMCRWLGLRIPGVT